MKKNGITNTEYFLLMGIYNAIPKDWIKLLGRNQIRQMWPRLMTTQIRLMYLSHICLEGYIGT